MNQKAFDLVRVFRNAVERFLTSASNPGRAAAVIYDNTAGSPYSDLVMAKIDVDAMLSDPPTEAAELQQLRDIRQHYESILQLVGEALGVEEEPHQTYWERLLVAAARHEPCALRDAVLARRELSKQIRDAGTPPHTDFWHQSIAEAEDRITAALNVPAQPQGTVEAGHLRCTCMTIGNSAQIAKADPECPRHSASPPGPAPLPPPPNAVLDLDSFCGDPLALLNSRHWLQAACEAKGAKCTGGGVGGCQADIDIELEGCEFNVSIRPRMRSALTKEVHPDLHPDAEPHCRKCGGPHWVGAHDQPDVTRADALLHIERHVRDIQILCDVYGLDPVQWLAPEEE